jgi:hypothetical protein
MVVKIRNRYNKEIRLVYVEFIFLYKRKKVEGGIKHEYTIACFNCHLHVRNATYWILGIPKNI